MLNVEKIQELLGNEYTCEAFTERKNNLTLNRVNIQKNGMNIGMCLNLSDQFETENELVNFFWKNKRNFALSLKKQILIIKTKLKFGLKQRKMYLWDYMGIRNMRRNILTNHSKICL